jgi:hypothetical protein
VSCLFLFGQRLLPHYAVARHISLAACLLDPTPPEHEFPTAPLASGLRGAGGGAVENSAPVPRLPTATFSAIFVRISTAIYSSDIYRWMRASDSWLRCCFTLLTIAIDCRIQNGPVRPSASLPADIAFLGLLPNL